MDGNSDDFTSERETGKRRNNSFHINFKEIIRKRVPIIQWLPNYTISILLQDLLAGFSVALTEIPQGIAYAGIAGLPLQYGLYCGFMGGFVYFIFGSCKDINIGPTSIMALMIQPHVLKLGYDLGIIITFLSGIIIFVFGLLHLGFVVDFFSYPIIAGFTSAAALNIASSQIKGLLGIKGKANAFLEAWESVIKNITQIRKWDAILGILTIIFLILMKEIRVFGSLQRRSDWSNNRNLIGKIIFMLSLARNALAVIIGTLLAYYIRDENGDVPFKITGTVEGGLPPFQLPPFSTTFNGTLYDFPDMIQEYGTSLAFIPLVAILESIAIGKAFSKGRKLDATQEMFALGVCNIMGSFFRSMPVTGSFTRTAVNNASGVKTTMAGVFTGIMVLLALSFLTSTFYFIPKATLAAVIICSMFYLFDFEAFSLLWRTKRIDLIPFLVTLLSGLFISLEYGIIIGIGTNLLFILYASARPKLDVKQEKITGHSEFVYVISPKDTVYFPATEYLRDTILGCEGDGTIVVINGKSIGNIDATVARGLSILVEELEMRNQKLFFLNCEEAIKRVCVGIDKSLVNRFKTGKVEDIFTDQNQEVLIH